MATQGKLRYPLMSVAKQGALLPFGHGAKREQSHASVHADVYLALSLIVSLSTELSRTALQYGTLQGSLADNARHTESV